MNPEIRDPKDYEKLIYKMAQRWRSSFRGIKELEDLVQDGWIVFLKLREREKETPITCPFSTALCMQIKQYWCNMLDQHKALKRGSNIKILSLDQEQRNETTYDYTRMIEKHVDLTDEIKILVGLLINAPAELIAFNKWYGTKDSIYRYLKGFKGWDKNRIKKLKKQIKLIEQ